MSWWKTCPNGHSLGVASGPGEDDDPCDRVSFVALFESNPGSYEPKEIARTTYTPPLRPWLDTDIVRCPSCGEAVP